MAPLYIYLAINRGADDRMTTKIGCVSDIEERLALLNATSPSPGSERRSRHVPGNWHMLLAIIVPETLSARALAKQWARDKRKPHCRFQYGIECIAWHFRLPYLIDFVELRADTALVSEIPDFVARLGDGSGVVADEARRVAVALATDTYVVPTTHSHTALSFARIDRPRDRYQKQIKKIVVQPITVPCTATPSLDELVRSSFPNT